MISDTDLYELLYVSCVASAMSISTVSAIAQESRLRNSRINVTGLLLFDGERFAQHIEGSTATVEALFVSIERDMRHKSVQVLQRGRSSARRFRRFSMGYANLIGGEPLEDLRLHSGAKARDLFTNLLSAVDFEP